MSTKPSHILGMNGRHQYTKLNPTSAKQYGFSKLRTKELLLEKGLPCAQIYHVFEVPEDLDSVIWDSIPTPFVIKPASGSAGKGVWIIKSRNPETGVWRNHDNDPLTTEDIQLHILNILDGEFSTWGSNHKAIIEEMIPSHASLAKLSYKGTPDIRVIVFNSVPVMAMARIPTKESEGKANLDRGAIGLGIDLATGITTFGIKGKGERITHFPGSKRKVNGVRIPLWTKVLEIAVAAAQAAGYVYMGADLFIHPDKGPMVVELNGYPGLSVQLANRAGLKRRLERVEGLEVRDPKHGVKIAQALFGESFADKIKIEEGIQIIPINTLIYVKGDDTRWHKAPAMINTGRYRSAISEELAQSLGLVDLEDLLWRQQDLSEGKLPVVEVSIRLKDHIAKTAMVVSKKLSSKKHKIELGRRDIQGFLIGDDES